MSKVIDLTGLSRFWANVDKRKASIDGKYPDLIAGDLVGRGESVPAEFSFRASGGKSIKDGTAWIKRLKGNSVVWNQKLGDSIWNVQFDDEQFEKSKVGATYIVSCDDFTPYESGMTAYTFILTPRIPIHAHQYLFIADAQGNYIQNIKCGVFDGSQYQFINKGQIDNTPLCVCFHTFSSDFVTDVVRFDVVVGLENYAKANTIRLTPRIYDLTQMFGAGNEPTTIEEFYARKPIVEDEYAYNEGEVIHMTAEGIKSVGDNAYNDNRDTFVVPTYVGAGIFEFANTKDVFVGVSRDGYIRQNSITQYTKLDNGYSFVNAQNTNGYGLGVFEQALPNAEYYLSWLSEKGRVVVGFYDEKGHVISHTTELRFTTPKNCKYILLVMTCIDNIFDQEIIVSDIMLTLVHSGWKQDTDAGYQPYWEDRLIFDQRIKDEFPDGMKSAGTAHDVAYNDMNKGVGVTETRIGVVDMGTLNWAYFSAFNCFTTTGLSAAKYPSDASVVPNIITSSYSPKSYTIFNDGNPNNVVTHNLSGALLVRDTSYTDAASFKEAMQGVLLYYELAEPIVTEHDEPFNLDYKVADFGTEQAIAEQPSAPISADIIYQFNAVDMIREHELEIAELQSIIATMQVQLASLTSNNG